MRKLNKDSISTGVVILLGLIIIGLALYLVISITSKSTMSNDYSRESYYQMVSEVTSDNIQFYVHDSQLYLTDSFDKVVGTIYAREDGTKYIEYNNKEYDLKDEDLAIKEVKKSE